MCSVYRVGEVPVNFKTGQNFPMKKTNALQMCIWLCVFYEFYQKKVKILLAKHFLQCTFYQISSRILATAIYEQLEGHVSDRAIKLLISFCYPDDVKKHPEANNPLDTNAPLFDITESLQIRPRQRQGPKEDPIYIMFFSKEQKRGMLKRQLQYVCPCNYTLCCRFK